MTHRRACVTQLMLYGVPLPHYLQQEYFEDYYPNSMLWQILCDIYRHHPRPLEELLQHYEGRLAALHNMPDTPASFHWEAFRRLHPVLQALYGTDAMLNLRHCVSNYLYTPFTGLAPDVAESEAYYTYMTHRMSGPDFFMEIQDSLFFNQLEAVQQNECLKKYLLKSAKENSRVNYGITSPEYNITRADHGYSLKHIKDVYTYAREYIRHDIRFQLTDWLSFIRYDNSPLNVLLANIMYTRWHRDKVTFEDIDINPWSYCEDFNPDISVMHYVERTINNTSLTIYVDMFAQCAKDSVMLELIDVLEHYQKVEPIIKQEGTLFL